MQMRAPYMPLAYSAVSPEFLADVVVLGAVLTEERWFDAGVHDKLQQELVRAVPASRCQSERFKAETSTFDFDERTMFCFESTGCHVCRNSDYLRMS